MPACGWGVMGQLLAPASGSRGTGGGWEAEAASSRGGCSHPGSARDEGREHSSWLQFAAIAGTPGLESGCQGSDASGRVPLSSWASL